MMRGLFCFTLTTQETNRDCLWHLNIYLFKKKISHYIADKCTKIFRKQQSKKTKKQKRDDVKKKHPSQILQSIFWLFKGDELQVKFNLEQ